MSRLGQSTNRNSTNGQTVCRVSSRKHLENDAAPSPRRQPQRAGTRVTAVAKRPRFAECFFYDTRHRLVFAECIFTALGLGGPLPSARQKTLGKFIDSGSVLSLFILYGYIILTLAFLVQLPSGHREINRHMS